MDSHFLFRNYSGDDEIFVDSYFCFEKKTLKLIFLKFVGSKIRFHLVFNFQFLILANKLLAHFIIIRVS